LRDSIGVVNGRVTALVVGDPERLTGKEGNSPGIEELGVGVVGYTSHVRDQIRLLIGIGLGQGAGGAERKGQDQKYGQQELALQGFAVECCVASQLASNFRRTEGAYKNGKSGVVRRS